MGHEKLEQRGGQPVGGEALATSETQRTMFVSRAITYVGPAALQSSQLLEVGDDGMVIEPLRRNR